MKRITFKTEHRQPILDGIKRATARWTDQGWAVGEKRAAVAPKPGKPAFLTPAKEAFAVLVCTKAEAKFWKDFTDEDARLRGVTRDWYLRERPAAGDFDRIFLYEFEVEL